MSKEQEVIEEEKIKKYDSGENSEEVQDIIERMPTKFGWWITGIVLFIVSLLLFFGWKVSYPDVVTGSAVINTQISPIKLIAKKAGKLQLMVSESQSSVKEGEIVAYIQSTASIDTLLKIAQILEAYNPNLSPSAPLLNQLPKKPALGSLTSSYYTFINSLQQWDNFKEDRLYDQQITGLKDLLAQQQKNVNNSDHQVQISRNNLLYAHKFYRRGSTLYTENVIAEAQLDQTQQNYLNSKSNYQSVYNLKINAVKEVRQTQAKIDGIVIQKNEKEEELHWALISTYNNLIDGIKEWRNTYTFSAPFDGKVQFLGFLTNNQFVETGQAVFTVIPKNENRYAQVSLPAAGAGKVKKGQSVIIKLNDFPYLEYGSIEGTVASISLTTKTLKNAAQAVEAYLVKVKLKNGLKTNYGKQLPFKQEARGTAEVITRDKRLIERLFDNLKYVMQE